MTGGEATGVWVVIAANESVGPRGQAERSASLATCPEIAEGEACAGTTTGEACSTGANAGRPVTAADRELPKFHAL